MKALLPVILAVVVVLGGIVLDYHLHGGATLLSYVLFFGAMAYVLFVISSAFRKPKGPAMIALLLLAGGLYSCKPTETAQSEAKQEKQVALEIPTRTYTVDGYDQTEEDKREW